MGVVQGWPASLACCSQPYTLHMEGKEGCTPKNTHEPFSACLQHLLTSDSMPFREREEAAQLEEQRRKAAVVERAAKFQDALAGQIAEKQQRRQEAAEQQRRDLQRMQEVAKVCVSLASEEC